MKVCQLAESAGLKVISMPEPQREIVGAYAGDLLSWVMGNAQENNLWITIMTNSNIVAVASLVDVSAILLAENVELDEKTAGLALEKGINILSSEKSIYELCVAAGGLL